ncbi:MAG TPA: tyrosine-type recombinase/integrase [Candidatus Tectomicrobia bacterium]|jgi:integrase/recombinase XerD|nr:tyrosine-type recombinase/integrase [Candidatus Tectomicrobia bacterium]
MARHARQAFWRQLRDYAQQTGLTKPASPHPLRHSFTIYLREGGADLESIQRLLGHTDISTTEMYPHVAPVRLQEPYYSLHPRA